MILSEIREYLQRRGQATLNDIALHFDAEPAALQGMLEVWIGKGKVRRNRITSACGSGCSRCDPFSTEIYVWCESDSDPRSLSPADCGHR
ncbi:MAG: FeoC-like transcriptional regulator [Gammaproteobacteria bacterium]|jgi:hypothetical protein